MTDQPDNSNASGPTEPGTAMAVAERKSLNLQSITSSRPSGSLAFLPRSMEDCVTIAQMMAKSDFAVPPKFRGNPGACLAVAMQSARWGADPFAVVQKAYVTKSKGGDERLAYEAQLVAAVVNTQAPIIGRLALTYTGEGQSRSVKCVGVFADTGEPREVITPPVSKINPKNSPLWVSDPDQQLAYYAMRAWGRRWTPEILLGIYTPEELQVIDADAAAAEASRPSRPVQVTSTEPAADETGIERVAEPEPAVVEEVQVVVEPEPQAVQEAVAEVPAQPAITKEDARVLDDMRPQDDEVVDETLGAGLRSAEDEEDAAHQTALDGWEAYLVRAIDGLMDRELSTEAQLDEYATKTKASLMSADGLSEDERDDLRARFVSKYLNAKRDRGFGRKAR